jgi:acetate kinase
MNVLVINCGSSSIKFQLFRMPAGELLIQGKAEKNESGNTGFRVVSKSGMKESSWEKYSWSVNFKKMLEELVNPENDCVASLKEIDVVGHRLIHGGEQDTDPGAIEITEELIARMEMNMALAPLHYPANLKGIRTTSQMLPGVLQAGVFDTSFHYSLPPKAFLYGIPLEWYHKHHIRRYGFHGTSHKFAVQRACRLAGVPLDKSRVISCHLGNGASVAAVKNGLSVDTSMGFTPVEGLLMGTRSGDIDAGVLLFLFENFNFSAADVQKLINKQGGLYGLSCVSADYRAVEKAAISGNDAARTALDVYHYRVKKYIGAYTAALGGLDVLVFTGGIGENSIRAREEICNEMEFLGIRISEKLNSQLNSREAIVSESTSGVKTVIVPANEELMIAKETARLASRLSFGKYPIFLTES